MKQLCVTLLGKLRVQCNGHSLAGCEPYKVQELFCYLLLNRDQPCAREKLASLLWGDHCTTSQSKAYLRKALWQLLTALKGLPGEIGQRLLHVEQEWIQLNSIAELWLDVAVFNKAYQAVRSVSGRDLDEERVQALEAAVQFYRGDLLENWYHDWCLCERERLFQVYLIMLNKLMEFCEVRGAYEAGLFYGACILQHDRAHERAHRHLMRLHHLAGDRTGALRQYERCVAALKEEFDAGPAESTIRLFEQIRQDNLTDGPIPAGYPADHTAPPSELSYLRQVETGLEVTLRQVRQAIAAVERQRLEEPSVARLSHGTA